ncbi:MAG: ATP-binding cassette domain-containing protein [Clostridia bacterium]|nr:ATP-binding cassette domain-containing protein [Clostridia bacterium]
MSSIIIKDLSFSYAGSLFPVFESLNLNLDTDWRLALTGDNGTGKTTLLKLLCGDVKGGGQISASVRFNRFPLEIADKEQTSYEAAYSAAPDVQLWEIEREINLLGMDTEILYRPYKTLSGGEKTKFMLAVTFAREGFALLDEPTDHLDIFGREKVAKYLSCKKGFIVVSHDKAFLNGCCDHVLALESTGAKLIRGSFATYAEEAAKKRQADAVKKQSLESESKRLKKSVERTSGWADAAERQKFGGNAKAEYAAVDRGFLGAKAAKMQKRAASVQDRRDKAENQIKELLKGFKEEEELKLTPEKYFKSRLAELKEVSVTLTGKALFKELNFTIDEGERVAVTGANGTGKTTLLKLIADGRINFEGLRNISPRLQISYVPQEWAFCGTLSEYAGSYGIEEGYYKAVLSKFGFEVKDFARPVNMFSEGQKKKAALARSLCERANLYIWDEPLNYLDISSRERLKAAILSSGISLVFVEHDVSFVNDVATRRVNL